MKDSPFSSIFRCGVDGIKRVARLSMLEVELKSISGGFFVLGYMSGLGFVINVNLVVKANFQRFVLRFQGSSVCYLFLC